MHIHTHMRAEAARASGIAPCKGAPAMRMRPAVVAQAGKQPDSPSAPAAPKPKPSSAPSPKPSPKTAASAPAAVGLVRPKAASSEAQKQAQQRPKADPKVTASPEALQAAWAAAVEAQKKGETQEVKVLGVTEAGLVVSLRPLQGFISFKNLAPERLKAATSAAGGVSTLVGQTIRAKISTADPSRKELILSEKRVATSEALAGVAAGQVVSGVVSGVEDYGALVAVRGLAASDGSEAEVTGLVHKSELSWEKLMTVDEAVKKGQEVVVKVVSVDAATCRLMLSLKAMKTDPLKTSIDDLPWSDSAVDSANPQTHRLVQQLSTSIGVTGVTVTRQAQDPHRVATELEVYLVRSNAESGSFTVLARYGASATELNISTELSREQFKQLLQRVASTVPV